MPKKSFGRINHLPEYYSEIYEQNPEDSVIDSADSRLATLYFRPSPHNIQAEPVVRCLATVKT